MLPLLRPGVIGPPSAIEIAKPLGRNFGQGFIWGSCCSSGSKTSHRQQVLWLNHLLGVWELVPYRGQGLGAGSGVRPEEWLRCFAHLLGHVACRCMRGTLLLRLIARFCSQLFQSGRWFLSLFVSCCAFLSIVTGRQAVFFCPLEFFVLRCWRRCLSRSKRCIHCSKGPRPLPVLSPPHRRQGPWFCKERKKEGGLRLRSVSTPVPRHWLSGEEVRRGADSRMAPREVGASVCGRGGGRAWGLQVPRRSS